MTMGTNNNLLIKSQLSIAKGPGKRQSSKTEKLYTKILILQENNKEKTVDLPKLLYQRPNGTLIFMFVRF